MITAPLRWYPIFFLFMYLLVVFSFFYEDLPTDQAVFYEGLFMDCYILCAILSLLPKKVYKYFKYLFYTVGYLVTATEWFLYNRFWLRYTPTTIQLLIETNSDEAGDFCRAFLISKQMGQVLLLMLLILTANVLLEIYEKPIRRFLRKQLTWRSHYLGYIGFSCFIVVYFVYCFCTTLENKKLFVEYFRLNGAERIERVMGPIQFYSPELRLAYSFKFTRLTAGEVEILRKTMHKLQVDSCDYKCPNIVFIIGESYNKHHSQLYGYPLETTPNLVRRQKKGELIRFDDVITPWNVTSNAFKSFLSTHADDEKGLWADGVLFPALFKKAGYHVSFFTQQFMKSSRLAAADFNGSFFLNDAELDSLCFDTRNKLKWTQDNGLIKEYGKHKGDYTDRNLFIFHLLGQHVEYKQRFPKAQEFFTIDNYKDRNDLSKAEKYIVADYDNATRYNDNVVDGIINLFVNEDAIVIYMPDHAEEVYDEIHAFGRLHDANLSPSLVRQEFEIPLAVWCSKKFRRRHRSEFKKLKSISKRPYKTDDIAHFMIGLAGIHTPFYNAERDWASDSYKLHPRIIKHTADYDSIMSSEKK